MAIYNNREVTVLTPSKFALPTTITVEYKDGSKETVALDKVFFTKSEKDKLVKDNPSLYMNVAEATDEDIKAVRLGVTPPSDPILKQQAQVKVQHQKQQELAAKQTEAAKAQVAKDMK